ncbi:hypothetical protein [Cryobacterium sp. Hb1]|uniref:hypothetical protein n=1 Tax=Cryobacterium sp. Hb1 TaxID=1259147 RepID=UPI00106A6617|nr:hypothetical protein [Cryobacterium sp. Hb1]TFD70091.1 hypothetical protein E3T38_06590 [Cryobacterium sp. Hb1]
MPPFDPAPSARQQAVLFEQAQTFTRDRDLALAASEPRRLESKQVGLELKQRSTVLIEALTASSAALKAAQAQLEGRDRLLGNRLYRRTQRESSRLPSEFKRA